MKLTANTLNIMAAKTCKGIGRAWITKNLYTPKAEPEIIELLNQSPKINGTLTAKEFSDKKNILKGLLAKSEGTIDGVTALGDDNFPAHRGIVKDSEKPVFIFYRGNLSLLNTESKNIAVIGLLEPDSDIEATEKKLVSEMVENGAVNCQWFGAGFAILLHTGRHWTLKVIR